MKSSKVLAGIIVCLFTIIPIAKCETIKQAPNKELIKSSVKEPGENMTQTKEIACYALYWDENESPDQEELTKAKKMVSNGKNPPVVHHLKPSDRVMLISSENMSKEDAYKALVYFRYILDANEYALGKTFTFTVNT